jgi:hypothetical protein
MKQTAVEWLESEFLEHYSPFDNHGFLFKVIKQAKEMEKQQIIDAYNTSFILRDKPYSTAEKYYNETFKSDII